MPSFTLFGYFIPVSKKPYKDWERWCQIKIGLEPMPYKDNKNNIFYVLSQHWLKEARREYGMMPECQAVLKEDLIVMGVSMNRESK